MSSWASPRFSHAGESNDPIYGEISQLSGLWDSVRMKNQNCVAVH